MDTTEKDGRKMEKGSSFNIKGRREVFQEILLARVISNLVFNQLPVFSFILLPSQQYLVLHHSFAFKMDYIF